MLSQILPMSDCFTMCCNMVHPKLRRQLCFVTNNTLVCEMQEDAMKVAHRMENGDCHDLSTEHTIEDLASFLVIQG